ncbi:hypothetical protein PXH69_24090 [Rhodococcus qingshengii]|uniref:Minor tail protein n=1 Tax=Rhodococcus qingshengii TaxID=334542 RepID=A0AAW6LLJ5_RHOSG|nr:hypothetical protein [Rhodococcus qingshengii]MDE8648063.1 hypothetical protein [Rhodococcus qingshengii]
MILVGDDGSRIELGPDSSDPVGLLIPSPGPKGSKGDKGDKGVGISAITVSGDNLVFDMSEGADIVQAVPALSKATTEANRAKTQADRAQTVADSIQDVADDAAQVAADRMAVAEDRTAVEADRQTTTGARDTAVSAKTAAEVARDDVHDTKAAVDNTKTLIDSTLATHGAQFTADLAASQQAATTATTQAGIATDAATVATAKRDDAETFASNAEQSAIDAANSVAGVSSIGGFVGAVSKAQLGIDKVDNVPDAEKPISGPTQGAFDLMSATFGNIIDGINTDLETKLNTAQVQSIANAAAAAIVDGSPASLDTLMELAAALGNDPHFATTVTNLIGTKSPLGHTHTASEVADSTVIGRAILKAVDAAAARLALGVDMPTDTRSPSPGSVTVAAMANAAKQDTLRYGLWSDTRKVGVGDGFAPDGWEFTYPVIVNSFKVQLGTADASGASTVVQMRKNGADVNAASATVAAGNLTASATGPFAFAAGDILTFNQTSVGTTPGKRLSVTLAMTRA